MEGHAKKLKDISTGMALRVHTPFCIFFLFVSYKNGIGPYGPIGNPIDFKFTERLPVAHAKTHVKNLRDISNGVVVRV